MISKAKLKKVDRWGAGLSFACALHCALQPLLVIALPVIGLGGLLNESLETWFLAFSILLATSTLWLGWLVHRQVSALFPLLTGIGLITLSRTSSFEAYELILAVAGALAITLSHGLNLQAMKQHECQGNCDALPHPEHRVEPVRLELTV